MTGKIFSLLRIKEIAATMKLSEKLFRKWRGELKRKLK